MRYSMTLASIVFCSLAASPALGQLQVHFTIDRIENLCKAVDAHGHWDAFSGQPDPIWYARILDAGGGIQATGHCTAEGDCTNAAYVGRTIGKVIPNRTTACFDFWLFDDDSDASDFMGSHKFCESKDASRTVSNNNNAVRISPVCGDNTEGTGYANAYDLVYEIRYEDQSGPVVSTPASSDDGLVNTGWDNDATIEFVWVPGIDPETGISQYVFVVDETILQPYFLPVDPDTSRVEVCSSCQLALPVHHGHHYSVTVHTYNGVDPVLSEPHWVRSELAYVHVDLVDPVTDLQEPGVADWQGSDFELSISDSDQGSGLGTASCRWAITSNGVEQYAWQLRTCNSAVTITVSEDGWCRDQGVDACAVYAGCVDLARRANSPALRTFSIDWTPDVIASLGAKNPADDNPIDEEDWTDVRNPVFSFAVSDSAIHAPISGYSWAVDQEPDCSPDVAGGFTGQVALPADHLEEGTHTFQVRAIDEAGNCGPVATLVTQVDLAEDPVPWVRAYDQAGGQEISEAAWQADNDPFFTWGAADSAAPIVGYAVGLGPDAPPCEATVFTTSYTVADDALADGQHVFQVRAMDASGHCGPSTSFAIWSMSSAPTLTAAPIIPGSARIGTTLLIEVTSDRDLLAPPSVELEEATGTATYIDRQGHRYTYFYTVNGQEAQSQLPVGVPVGFLIEAEDLGGNLGSARVAFMLDLNPPELSGGVSVEPPVATAGDNLVIRFDSLEALQEPPDPEVTIFDGAATLLDRSDTHFDYTYVVTGGEGEGAVPIQVLLTDLAGNSMRHTSSFVLDITPPEVHLLSPVAPLVLDLGGDVDLAWQTVDEHPGVVSLLFSADGGQSFDHIIAEDVPDTGHFTWTVDTAETLEARLLVQVTDLVGLSASAQTSHDLRVRTAVADHLALSADDGEVTAGDVERVRVAVLDALGDPIRAAVELSVVVDGAARIVETSLAGAVVDAQTVSGTTGHDGTAWLDISDKVAERVQVMPSSDALPATVSHVGTAIDFSAGAADHSVATATDGVAAPGGVEQLTLALVDVHGNPVSSDLPIVAAVGGSARITATSLGSAIGLGGSLVHGRLDGDGRASIDVVDTEDETISVFAHCDNAENTVADVIATVRFSRPITVDASQTTLHASPTSIIADGHAHSALTVTPRNSVGENITGALLVEIVATRGELDLVVDQGDGTHSSRLRADTCHTEPSVVTARVDGVEILQQAEVGFICAEPASVSLWAAQTGPAHLGAMVLVEVEVRNDGEQPISELWLHLSSAQELDVTSEGSQWRGVSISVFDEEDLGGQRVDLGVLEGGSSTDPPLLVLAVQLPDVDPGVMELDLRAYQGNEEISDVKTINFPIATQGDGGARDTLDGTSGDGQQGFADAVAGDAQGADRRDIGAVSDAAGGVVPGDEACGCQSSARSDVGWLVALLVVALSAPRRRGFCSFSSR